MDPNVKALLEQLETGDATDRRYALEDLVGQHDPNVIDQIARAIDDPLVAVQEAAVDTLIATGGREVCMRAIDMLKSENTEKRNYATEILQNTGQDAIDKLVELCDDPAANLRKSAIDIIGKLGAKPSSHAFEKIAAKLNDPNLNVQAAAAEALGEIGDPQALPILLKASKNAPPWVLCHIFPAIAAIGTEQAGTTLQNVDHENLPEEAKIQFEVAKAALNLQWKEPT